MTSYDHNKHQKRTKPEILTLRDLYEFIARQDIPTSTKSQIRSAIKRIDALIGHGNMDLPAEPREIMRRLKIITAHTAGMSKGGYANTVSRVRAAFRLAEPALQKSHVILPLSGGWSDFHRGLDRKQKLNLSRLIHYANRQGWKPGEICDDHIDLFTQYLRDEKMVVHWEQVRHNTIRVWNRVIASREDLQRLQPRHKRKASYWLPQDKWPEGLRTDLARVLYDLGHPDIFGGKAIRSLKPSTIEQYRHQASTLVSAAVGSGIPLASLQSLTIAMSPNIVIAALNYLKARADGKISTTMIQMVIRVLVMARMLGLSANDQATLERVHSNLLLLSRKEGRIRGLTDKNRRLLDQLANDQHFADLIYTLPIRLTQEARANPHKRQAPVLMRTALAIEILLICSMRRENLMSLELDRSLKRVGMPPHHKWVIEFDGQEIKNGDPLRFTLNPSTAELLEEYLAAWRHKLSNKPGPWLFPDQNGSMLNPKTMGSVISTHCKRITGTAITPHQFRHISAETFLMHHPEKLDVISDHLGHRDRNTTRTYYARSRQKQASDLYQRNVLKQQEAAKERLKTTRRKPRRCEADQED